MTARIEIYDDNADPDDESIACVLTGEVPRIGDSIWLNAMDAGRHLVVKRVEWFFDAWKADEIPQVAVYVSVMEDGAV